LKAEVLCSSVIANTPRFDPSAYAGMNTACVGHVFYQIVRIDADVSQQLPASLDFRPPPDDLDILDDFAAEHPEGDPYAWARPPREICGGSVHLVRLG